MKQHTIKLTEDQISEIIHALEMDINEDFGTSDPSNRKINRIIAKLTNELSK